MACFRVVLLAALCALAACIEFPSREQRDAIAAAVPRVTLRNAARPQMTMPATGLGTGGYGFYFENATEVVEAVNNWLLLGGERIDASLTYKDQVSVGQGIKQSKLPRSSIFITSKVGPGDPLGYNETLDQFAKILQTLDVSYVDLLLIHWPGPASNSTDPACHGSSSSPAACRKSTWRALERIFNEGKAHAIGVSNFEPHHLNDILELKSLVPAVIQNEYHPYWAEDDWRKVCESHGIVYNGYSPLGAPDVSKPRLGWNLLDEPVIKQIASEIQRTPAEVLLAFEYGHNVIVNPRTKVPEHMKQNIGFFDVKLSAKQVEAITSLKAPAKPKVCPDPNEIP